MLSLTATITTTTTTAAAAAVTVVSMLLLLSRCIVIGVHSHGVCVRPKVHAIVRTERLSLL